TAADNRNGIWQFSTDQGKTWAGLGDPSEGTARLLAADTGATRLRFVPATNFHGSATLTFRAWDQTAGSNGGTAAIGQTGGAAAFSAAAATATLTVFDDGKS